jgi:hypothetical protein
MDYGTGHELSFLAYLLILRLICVFSEADEGAIVDKCFSAYRQLVGRLQHSFKLEAAGKLGVWGTDEHEHLVYHSAASQSRSELVFLLPSLSASLIPPSSPSPRFQPSFPSSFYPQLLTLPHRRPLPYLPPPPQSRLRPFLDS